jgi:hypothetical protein
MSRPARRRLNRIQVNVMSTHTQPKLDQINARAFNSRSNELATP